MLFISVLVIRTVKVQRPSLAVLPELLISGSNLFCDAAGLSVSENVWSTFTHEVLFILSILMGKCGKMALVMK